MLPSLVERLESNFFQERERNELLIYPLHLASDTDVDLQVKKSPGRFVLDQRQARGKNSAYPRQENTADHSKLHSRDAAGIETSITSEDQSSMSDHMQCRQHKRVTQI